MAIVKLAAEEAKVLNVANYMSSIALDVHAYEAAMDSLSEENASLEKKWETMQSAYVKDIQRFQNAMQGSDAVFWFPEQRKNYVRTRNGCMMPLKRAWKTARG